MLLGIDLGADTAEVTGCGEGGSRVIYMGIWTLMGSHTMGSQQSWGPSHGGLNTHDHMDWDVDMLV